MSRILKIAAIVLCMSVGTIACGGGELEGENDDQVNANQDEDPQQECEADGGTWDSDTEECQEDDGNGDNNQQQCENDGGTWDPVEEVCDEEEDDGQEECEAAGGTWDPVEEVCDEDRDNDDDGQQDCEAAGGTWDPDEEQCEDDVSNDGEECADGEIFNPISGECVDDSDGNGDDNGDSPYGDAMFCQPECTTASDCGDPDSYDCDGGVCKWTVQDSGSCDTDSECIALMSGWHETCDSQSECDTSAGEDCLEYEGQGYCIFGSGPGWSCSDFGLDEIDLDRVGESGQETACAQLLAFCTDDGFCGFECSDDSDCDYPGSELDTCLAGGYCGCGSDASCDDVPGGDICHDFGFCGCSDDAACDTDMVCDEL